MFDYFINVVLSLLKDHTRKREGQSLRIDNTTTQLKVRLFKDFIKMAKGDPLAKFVVILIN